MKEKDYTPGGIRIEGTYENDRNADSSELLKAIIREVFGVKDVIIAHHLVYVRVEQRDGFDYQVVEEIPAMDTLIFDHEIAKRLWGEPWRDILVRLAMEPCDSRDKLLCELFHARASVLERAGV